MSKASPTKHAPSPAVQVRVEVREHIRNERDLLKSLMLGETVKSIDRTREEFEVKRLRGVKKLPTNIMKFIGTLKRCVRRTIKKKGGTPYSIVRALFMYWGSGGEGPSGTLNGQQLGKCMSSLGVVMSSAEINDVIAYYSSLKDATTLAGAADHPMSYNELLADVIADEPTVLQYTGQKYFDGDDIKERFTEHEDAYAHVPLIVKQFVEATQNYVMTMMRTQGGTPHYHVRELFNQFDYNQSSGLDASELQLAAKKKMKLTLTLDQARDVVKFYDRKRIGQMSYDSFLGDIAKSTKPMLDFTEVTADERQKAIDSLSKNPLMPKPFQPKPNRMLEDLKIRIRNTVEGKVGTKGGRLESWVTEAFRSYDKDFTQCLSNWKDVQGVMSKLGVQIEPEIASMLLRTFDVRQNGKMNYTLFIKDLVTEDSHFLQTVDVSPIKVQPGVTSRTPAGVAKTIQSIRNSCNVFARKSSGALQARDLLYGTCLRFDTEKSGRIPPFAVMNVAKELSVGLQQDAVNALVDWFDTNATHTLDYNALTKQIYGSDVMNSALQLPKLHKRAGKADCHDTVKYNIGCKTQSEDATSDDLQVGGEPSDSAAARAGAGAGVGAGAALTVFHSGMMNLMNGSPSPNTAGNGKQQKSSPARKKDKNYVLLKKKGEEPVGGNEFVGKLHSIAEAPAIEAARLDSKRAQVVKERDLICSKLKEVEATRKKLNDDFTKRRNEAHEALMREKHRAEYDARLAKRLEKGK
jgi:Ca2+-binding EF-hand superfamily protein